MSGRVGSITTAVIEDGLVFNMDAANRASCIPSSNTTIAYNTIDSSVSGSFNDDVSYLGPPTSASCFTFDGVDDYILTNTRLAEVGQTDITLNFWFKIVGSPTVNYHGLINEFAAHWPKRSRILINENRNKAVYILQSTQRIVNFLQTLSLDTWYYFTLTKDSINGSKIYINAEYNGGDVGDTSAMSGEGASTYPGTIFGLGAETVYYMNGNIANIQCYNRALTPIEIQHNYNALKGRFN
jgi:hypothetical protein